MPGNSKYTLDKVSAELLQEVTAELEAGRNEALERVRVALQETKSQATKITETGERQAESMRRQILGSAELEARNMALRAIEDASNGVFRKALDDIAQNSARYEKSLEKLIGEGMEVIGKDAVVECNSKDKKMVSGLIKDINTKRGSKLTLEEKALQTVGGVALHSKDMVMRFDNTFEARLERVKPQLRREIARMLSGDESK